MILSFSEMYIRYAATALRFQSRRRKTRTEGCPRFCKRKIWNVSCRAERWICQSHVLIPFQESPIYSPFDHIKKAYFYLSYTSIKLFFISRAHLCVDSVAPTNPTKVWHGRKSKRLSYISEYRKSVSLCSRLWKGLEVRKKLRIFVSVSHRGERTHNLEI